MAEDDINLGRLRSAAQEHVRHRAKTAELEACLPESVIAPTISGDLNLPFLAEHIHRLDGSKELRVSVIFFSLHGLCLIEVSGAPRYYLHRSMFAESQGDYPRAFGQTCRHLVAEMDSRSNSTLSVVCRAVSVQYWSGLCCTV